MATTVPMPAWLRTWQQTWYWQNLLLPAIVGFGGSLVLAGCLKDLMNIDHACVMGAINTTILTFATAWVKGHSVGSTMFASDGTTIAAAPALKQLADAQVTVAAKAADPASPTTSADADEVKRTLGIVGNEIAVAANTAQAKIGEVK